MKAETLKKSILQLAVEGKLVPQIKTEGTAKELLDKIREEKEQLIKEKKIKRDKDESVIYREKGHFYEKVGKKEPVCIDDEIPFDIPDSWEWARLKSISTKVVDGDHNPPKGESQKTQYLMLSSQNINDDRIVNIDKTRYLTREIFEKENKRTNVTQGDIFFTSVGTLGRSCVYYGDYNICFQRSVSVITTLIYNYYLKYTLDSRYMQNKIRREATGTAQKGFYLRQLNQCLIPVPPFLEQERIVEKIEELLPHIEEYNVAEQELKKLNQEFPEKMKQSVLQYAVEGKLVPQIESEGTAKELLDKIREEKEQLIKEKKIKRDKNESVIYRENGHFYEKVGKEEPVCIDDEIPFDIPDSWEWMRLSHLFQFINGDRGKNYPSKDKLLEYGEIPFISAGNIKNQSIDEEGLLFVDESRYDKLGSGKLNINDFVICIRGSIGKFCVYPYEIGAIASSLVILRPICKEYLDYGKIYYNSGLFFSEIKKYDNGTAQPNLSATNLKKFFIPIPPLSEQRRIVERIEEILPLIKEL